MKAFERFVKKFCSWSTVVGAVFILAVNLIIVVTIVGRAIHIALPGTFDLAETLVVVGISFAIVFTQVKNRHIRAELVIQRLKGRVKSGVESFIGILNIFYWALLFYAGFMMLVEKLERGEATILMNIPIVPFRVVFVFCLMLMVILLVILEIHHIKALIKGKEDK